MAQCKYESEIGKIRCEEEALPTSPKGYCIFHEELENKNIEDCMKLFYGKLIVGETNFEGYILKNVDFSEAGINQVENKDRSMWFNNARFYGDFSANGVKFLGFTSFHGAEFYGNADFSNAFFANGAIFDAVNFHGTANFLLAEFLREARFSGDTFFESSEFVDVTFKGPAFFSNCIFRKAGIFTDTEFERGGSFNHAQMNFTSFENTKIKDVSFDEVNPTNFEFHGAKLKEVDFSGTLWKSPWKSLWRRFILRGDVEAIKGKTKCKECSGVIIGNRNECDCCGRYFVEMDKEFSCPKCNTKNEADSKECINKDCNAKFSARIKNEKYYNSSDRADMFKKAEDVYRNIKLNLQDEGDYQTAGEFYFNEMVMRRKRSLHERNILDWLISHLISKICGYGERASRVITGSLLVVFLLAFIYFIFGAIIKAGSVLYNPNFLECLYFSFVTFTTLGYGDYAPSQSFQLLATSEAFFGAFMIALFVLVFGRKMIR